MTKLLLILLLAAGFSAALAGPAAADPGTLVVAALGGTAALGTMGAALVQLGVGLAVSSLARALRPKPKVTGGGLRTEFTMDGGTLPQTLILGRYCTAGTHVAPPYARGRANDVPNGYRYQIIDLADVPLTELRKIWIDATEFRVADHLVGSLGSYDGASPNPVNRAQWAEVGREAFEVHFYDGRQTTADPKLVDVLGNHAERPWSAGMVGKGVAYLWTKHRYDTELYQGEPQLRAEVYGAKLYDRRKDTTAGGSGTHRFATQSTWDFSQNPITMVEAILRGLPLADGTTWGLGVAVADMPFSTWAAAANHCDQTVDGDTRYRAGYEARLATADQGGDEPFDVIDELLKSCAGSIADCGGLWQVRAGPPGLPVAYLTDEDIVVSRPQDFEPHRGVTDVYNSVRATFPRAAKAWTSSEAPLRVDSAAEAEDGERLVADLALPAVWNDAQVQRLQKLFLKDARRMRRHTITLPPEYSGILPLDVISWNSARNGYITKLFEVAEVAIEPRTLAVTLAIREVDPSDYDWEPGDLLPAVDPSPTRVVIAKSPLPGFAVEGVILTDASGASRRPALLMTWPDTLTSVRSITWEIRVLATAAPAPGGSTANIRGGQAIASDGLVGGTAYEVRARGDRTDWTGWLPATTPAVRFGASDLEQSILDSIAAAQLEAEGAAKDALDAYNEAVDVREDMLLEVAAAESRAVALAQKAALLSIQGTNVLRSPQFEDDAHWLASGAVTRLTNLVYPQGKTLEWTIALTTDVRFVQTRSNIAGAFFGVFDYNAFRIEADLTLVSGGLGGAGISVEWIATDATVHIVHIPFTDSVAAGAAGRRTLTAVIKRPSGFGTKTLSFMRIYVMGGHETRFGTNVAKTLQVHRVAMRVATNEELGGGLVGSTIAEAHYTKIQSDSTTASIQQLIQSRYGDATAYTDSQLVTYANADSALAARFDEMSASLDFRSFVREFDFSGSTLDGMVARSLGNGAPTITFVTTTSLTPTLKRTATLTLTGVDGALSYDIAAASRPGLRGKTIRVTGHALVTTTTAPGGRIRARVSRQVSAADTTHFDTATSAWMTLSTSYQRFSLDVALADTQALPYRISIEVEADTGRVFRLTDIVMGDVSDQAELKASITQTYLATADLDSALASLKTNVNSSFGGMSSNVDFSMATLASLNGNVARFAGLVTVDGVKTATGIEAIAWNNSGGATGSVVLLHGDNVIAPGTLSTNMLVVGLGANLLKHSSFIEGTRGWGKISSGTVGTQTVLQVRSPGQNYAGKTYPTLVLNQTGTAISGTTAYADMVSYHVNSDGSTETLAFEVKAGDHYDFSVQVALLRCNAQLRLLYLDASGNELATFTASIALADAAFSFDSNPKSWPRFWVKGQAPSGAVFAQVRLRKYGTLSGADSLAAAYRPMVGETHAKATFPTPYSPEGTTYISGGRLITRSMKADVLEVGALTAASGVFARASIDAVNVRGFTTYHQVVATLMPKRQHANYVTDGYRLTNTQKPTANYLTLGSVYVKRVTGGKTKFTGSILVGGWGTDATAAFRIERKTSGGSWVLVGGFVAECGYRGRSRPVAFVCIDDDTSGTKSQGSSNTTAYRVRVGKHNGITEFNHDPKVKKMVLEALHFRSNQKS